MAATVVAVVAWLLRDRISLFNVTFEGNLLGDGGSGRNGGDGGRYNETGSISCTLCPGGTGGDGGDNGNSREGSALWLGVISGGTQSILNCLFVENQVGQAFDGVAGLGGAGGEGSFGGFATDGADGSAGADGRFVLGLSGTTPNLDVRNSIFWDNYDADGVNLLLDQFDLVPGGLTVEYSVAQNDVADLGSPTGVIDPVDMDWESSRYVIGLCSPAKDAGDPSTVLPPNAKDVYGSLRAVGTIDMGPVELQNPVIIGVGNAGSSNSVQVDWSYPDSLRDALSDFAVYRKSDGPSWSSWTGSASSVITNDVFAGQDGLFDEYCVQLRDDDAGSGCPTAEICGPGRLRAAGRIEGRVESVAGAGVEFVEVCAKSNANMTSFRFNGSSQYAYLDSAEEAYDQLTMETWIRIDAYPATEAALIEKRNVSLLGLTSGGKLRFRHGDGSGYNTNSIGDQSVPVATWVHVAVTYDRNHSTGDADIILYIDGEVDDSFVKTGTVPMSGVARGRFVAARQAGDGSFSDFYDGRMDEVAIWSRVKSEAEIKADYQRILVGNESGLESYYRMEDYRVDSVLYALD